MHHDCWRVRCLRGRDAFLRHVKCGICWEVVELDFGMKRRLYYDVSDDEAPEARRPRKAAAKRSMMDDDEDANDSEAAKRMREAAAVSPVTASLNLLSVNENKRSASMELLNDNMKRARI